MLKFTAVKAGRVTVAIATARETQRCKKLVEHDCLNYVAVGKLIAAKWAVSQGCTIDWTKMDLYDIEGYDDAVAVVTKDMITWEELQPNAKNFSSFPVVIHEPEIPPEFKTIVDKTLVTNPLPDTSTISVVQLEAYSQIRPDAQLAHVLHSHFTGDPFALTTSNLASSDNSVGQSAGDKRQ